MRTLSRSILVLACLLSLSLIGLSGCEQAEEAKKAGGELMTETVDKAQQIIGEVTGNTGESEDEGKKEDAEPTEDEGKKEDVEPTEDEGKKENVEPTEDEGKKENVESAEEKANEEIK